MRVLSCSTAARSMQGQINPSVNENRMRTKGNQPTKVKSGTELFSQARPHVWKPRNNHNAASLLLHASYPGSNKFLFLINGPVIRIWHTELRNSVNATTRNGKKSGKLPAKSSMSLTGDQNHRKLWESVPSAQLRHEQL